MPGPWCLVTPASRGLGLALARQVLRQTRVPVVATSRKDLPGTRERLLDGLEDSEDAERRLTVLELDVLGSPSSSSPFLCRDGVRASNTQAQTCACYMRPSGPSD